MAYGASLLMGALFGSARVRRTSWMLSTCAIVAVFVLAALLPLAQASPIPTHAFKKEEPAETDPEDPELWVNLLTAAALVLLGGAFAGLTIAYVYLSIHHL
jgi:hypothetical protein